MVGQHNDTQDAVDAGNDGMQVDAQTAPVQAGGEAPKECDEKNDNQAKQGKQASEVKFPTCPTCVTRDAASGLRVSGGDGDAGASNRVSGIAARNEAVGSNSDAFVGQHHSNIFDEHRGGLWGLREYQDLVNRALHQNEVLINMLSGLTMHWAHWPSAPVVSHAGSM